MRPLLVNAKDFGLVALAKKFDFDFLSWEEVSVRISQVKNLVLFTLVSGFSSEAKVCAFVGSVFTASVLCG